MWGCAKLKRPIYPMDNAMVEDPLTPNNMPTLLLLTKRKKEGKNDMYKRKGWLTFNKDISFPYSLRMFRRNSLLRTGKLQNNFFTVTVVPIWRAILLSATRRPEWSKVNCVATDSFFVLVSTVKSPKAQRELSASPLKPKVANDWRSGKSANLDVWCLSARTCQKQYRLQNFQSLQKEKKMILWGKKGLFQKI